MQSYQVAVLGGGPAGLAAALTLSRAMISTVVFDGPEPPRNAAARQVRGLAGRDLTPPAAFRAAVAEEIARYGHAERRDVAVEAISGDLESGFLLYGSDGTQVGAERLLLATGMVDLLPALPGFGDFWGESIVNCPFCDGFELQGQAWAVLADRPEMLEAAEVYRNWTDDLVFIVPPEVALAPARAAEIEAAGTKILRRAVVGLSGEGARLRELELDDGTRLARDVLLVFPRQRQCRIVEALAPETDAEGYLVVDAGFRSSLPGVYAAGDLLHALEQNANTSLHMGHLAAVSLVFDICKAR
ncbi:MAG: NAD(P)/FAD-dependent oxidoreductase [Rhodospirillales bacterium]